MNFVELLLRAAVIAVCALIVIPGATSRSEAQTSDLKTITMLVGGKDIKVTVADTDQSRMEGLLGWSSITDEQGLLLEFSAPGEYAIHMQGMKFPIDAVWINANGKITLIYEEIMPNSGLIYASKTPAGYCLELNAGYCQRHDVKIGQEVVFK
jgi:uncharacterized protein